MGRTGWVVVAGVSSGLAGRSEALMRIDRLDHLVLTVADVGRTVEFYERVLGMQAVTFGGGRRALRFGTAKINLHQAGQEFEPKAARPVPGSADLCLISSDPLPAVCAELAAHGVAIEEGPVARTGATGAIRSVYIRDPDGNLIEISNYLAGEPGEAAGATGNPA
jgi:catechol 2,3-dioxygenase-like lactoylglutathione lyase family enzyme